MRRKVCPKCGVEKNLRADQFVFIVSRKTGRRLWKHCRLCDRKRQRRVRKEVKRDPERHARYLKVRAANQRRRYSADPDRYRGYSRDYKRRLRETDPQRYLEVILIPRRFQREGRKLKVPAVEAYRPPSQAEMVPAAPLASYLRTTFPGWLPDQIARFGDGVSARWLRNVLDGQEAIELDAADRLLTGLGKPWLFNVLYPPAGKGKAA